MKNLAITIVIIIVIVGGIFFLGRSKSLQAPAVVTEDQSNTLDTGGVTIPLQTDDATVGTYQSPSTAVVKEFTVSGKNFSFSPSFITVKKGDKVKITFQNSEGFHDFVIDEFGAVTKQTKSPTTEVIEFTADKVGSFEYYCSVGSHRAMGMKGTLVVN